MRNPGVEEEIKGSLDRLGEALSVGDLAGAASGWEIPGLVLSDAGAIPVVDRPQIEAFFGHAVASYRSQGLMATRPELERTVTLTDRLTTVDVRWPAFDETGTERSSEHSHYILRRGDDGHYRIQVALTITAAP